MVTLLDTGLLEFLLPIFSILFVYAILFGVLQKSKFISESGNINGWVAFFLAALFAIMPGAMQFISVIAPWFVVMLLIAFSFVLIFLFLGVKLEKITEITQSDATVRWTIIILSVIILIAGLTSVFGPLFGTPTSDGGGMGREIQRSVFDPKVLTTVFVLLIAGQAVRLISQKD
jgi:hypothetical protein